MSQPPPVSTPPALLLPPIITMQPGWLLLIEWVLVPTSPSTGPTDSTTKSAFCDGFGRSTRS